MGPWRPCRPSTGSAANRVSYRASRAQPATTFRHKLTQQRRISLYSSLHDPFTLAIATFDCEIHTTSPRPGAAATGRYVKHAVANFLAFQTGWIACVLSGAHGVPLVGTGLALALVGAHILSARNRSEELRLVLLVALLGAIWDSLLTAAGWLKYASGVLVPGTAPYWIVAMWMLFATTLNVSLRWLRGRPLLAAVVGAAGGPLAYLAGSQLGGVVLAEPVLALTALALGWSVMVPLLVLLAQRLDGFQSPGGPAAVQPRGSA